MVVEENCSSVNHFYIAFPAYPEASYIAQTEEVWLVLNRQGQEAK